MNVSMRSGLRIRTLAGCVATLATIAIFGATLGLAEHYAPATVATAATAAGTATAAAVPTRGSAASIAEGGVRAGVRSPS